MALTETAILDTEQEKFLDQALKAVHQESFEMKRCLDKTQYVEAFKHSAILLSELRTSTLSPKFYYRLYVDIVNELSHLSTTLSHDNSSCENPLARFNEFYEVVQYAGNIIPRLYLLISVGVVYFKIEGSPRKEILKDLVEMCRGVQHPIRGLFLRNFLITMTKELLPDTPVGDDSNPAGNVADAIEIIIENFCEMNKLWVRMQHQGPSREKEKREKERRELRILVGTNLVRLSQLENLTLEMYRNTVLPRVLEQAVSCREPISQEYLMECVIQVFSDEFHLATLNEFLDACAELSPEVRIKNVLGALIDRLAIYATAEGSPGIPEDIPLFDIFSKHAGEVIGSREGMPPEDVIAIQTALVNLATKCYPDNNSYANTVFGSTAKVLKTLNITGVAPNSNVGRELMKMIKMPIEQHNDIIKVLSISELSELIKTLNYRGRCLIGAFIINNILENGTQLKEENDVNGIFELVETLIFDSDDIPEEIEKSEEFKEDQELVAKLVSMMENDDVEVTYTLLKNARKHFGKGGKHRLRFTLPSLIFATYKLLHRFNLRKDEIEDFDEKIHRLFQFVMKTINALKSEADCSAVALKLYIQGALSSDVIAYENSATVTYEFISKAISIYEEDIDESKEQVRVVHILIGTLQQLRRLTEENMDPLTSKCAVLAAKLLKKQDQARAISKVAHMFWFSQYAGEDSARKDSQRVAECLRKALRVSSQCMDDLVQIQLFTHILNEFLFFYERGCSEIKTEELNKLIDKIRDSVYQLEKTPEAEPIIDAFNKTILYVKERQSIEGDNIHERFEGIVIT
ncbi:hypothetical protein FO519_004926 [Halicephalobus sp. NKZ332]|nr:hypothetical protein FO519_004926 [Halicephalobus sp. NKZ332]